MYDTGRIQIETLDVSGASRLFLKDDINNDSRLIFDERKPDKMSKLVWDQIPDVNDRSEFQTQEAYEKAEAVKRSNVGDSSKLVALHPEAHIEAVERLIRSGVIKPDGDPAHKQEYSYNELTACEIWASAGTNIPRGGAAGHGGVTVLELRFGGAARIMYGAETLQHNYNSEILRIEAEGDCEGYLLLNALKFAVAALETQIADNWKKTPWKS